MLRLCPCLPLSTCWPVYNLYRTERCSFSFPGKVIVSLFFTIWQRICEREMLTPVRVNAGSAFHRLVSSYIPPRAHDPRAQGIVFPLPTILPSPSPIHTPLFLVLLVPSVPTSLSSLADGFPEMSFSLPIPDLWFKVTVVLLISENSDSGKGEQPLLPRVGCIQALEKGALCSGLLSCNDW